LYSICDTGKKKKREYSGAVHPLFISLKKACDLVMRKVLYIVFNEFDLLTLLLLLPPLPLVLKLG
jgi:hypothetical protein